MLDRLRPFQIRRLTVGFCPICQRRTVFIARHAWLRDHLKCLRCRSIPRWRAVIVVLETHFPAWRAGRLHESSPGGAASNKLARECAGYEASNYFTDTPAGQRRNGTRCENLEHQTFADATFDLVVTQDVFEHVLHPEQAFREVARTLKPGGAHVFTVPWYYWKKTVVRATGAPGAIEHLLAPEYHGNPIDANGSLVITEWGHDLTGIIETATGLSTTVMRITDRRQGIEGKFIEVFITQKGDLPPP
jgi:SAM-dependent methyltransferase